MHSSQELLDVISKAVSNATGTAAYVLEEDRRLFAWILESCTYKECHTIMAMSAFTALFVVNVLLLCFKLCAVCAAKIRLRAASRCKCDPPNKVDMAFYPFGNTDDGNEWAVDDFDFEYRYDPPPSRLQQPPPLIMPSDIIIRRDQSNVKSARLGTLRIDPGIPTIPKSHHEQQTSNDKDNEENERIYTDIDETSTIPPPSSPGFYEFKEGDYINAPAIIMTENTLKTFKRNSLRSIRESLPPPPPPPPPPPVPPNKPKIALSPSSTISHCELYSIPRVSIPVFPYVEEEHDCDESTT